MPISPTVFSTSPLPDKAVWLLKKSIVQFDAMVLAQTAFLHEVLLHRTGAWTAMLHAIPSVMDMV